MADMETRGWMPIETAPRDQYVLAWQPGAYRPYIAEQDEAQWWTNEDQYNDPARFFPPTCNPTHWMPLPEAPEDTGHDKA